MPVKIATVIHTFLSLFFSFLIFDIAIKSLNVGWITQIPWPEINWQYIFSQIYYRIGRVSFFYLPTAIYPYKLPGIFEIFRYTFISVDVFDLALPPYCGFILYLLPVVTLRIPPLFNFHLKPLKFFRDISVSVALFTVSADLPAFDVLGKYVRDFFPVVMTLLEKQPYDFSSLLIDCTPIDIFSLTVPFPLWALFTQDASAASFEFTYAFGRYRRRSNTPESLLAAVDTPVPHFDNVGSHFDDVLKGSATPLITGPEGYVMAGLSMVYPLMHAVWTSPQRRLY